MDKLNIDSPSVQTHLNILQGIISRMASNSVNCKMWAITIISAMSVLLITNEQQERFAIILIPLFLIFFLDCIYLGQERFFKEKYNIFVKELHGNDFDVSQVFVINTKEKKAGYFCKALWSFSTTPFYLTLAFLVFLLRYL